MQTKQHTKHPLIFTALAMGVCMLLTAVLSCVWQPQGPLVSGAFTVAGDNPSETRRLPIVMYHSLLKTRKGKYTLHPDSFEADIIAYKKMGYTPVFVREVVDFVEGKGTLPPKPMVITFDDGNYNNMYYALDIIKRHEVKVVINVITSHSEFSAKTGDINPNYSCLTWDQIRELDESGYVEIGNHTHAMHRFKPRYGIGRKNGEDDDTYRTAIREDFQKAQDFLTSCAHIAAPVTFAYPFGKYSKEGREVLLELGFKALLTCNEGINEIHVGDYESLLYLKRYNRSGNTTTERFVDKVFGELESR